MHYDHVSLYEAAFADRTEDVAYFCEISASAGDAVLEYGAGAGRVTLPLLERGLRVFAVEKSEPMHTRLSALVGKLSEEAQARAHLILGDMTTVSLSQKFPLVLATFNVIAHLQTHRELAAFFRRAKQHLAPQGRLVFDTLLPHADEVHADPRIRYEVPPFRDEQTGKLMLQTERYEYDPLAQTLLVESQYRSSDSDESLTVPLVLRQWFPKEIEALLEYEGFEDIRTCADYTDAPGVLAENALIFSAAVADPTASTDPTAVADPTASTDPTAVADPAAQAKEGPTAGERP